MQLGKDWTQEVIRKLDKSNRAGRSSHRGKWLHLLRHSALPLTLGVAVIAAPALAAPGDSYNAKPEFNISVGVRLAGPGFSTYASAVTFLNPDNEPSWSYCIQAPVPGGGSVGTETALEDLNDSNSQAVRDNAHRIAAVLSASTLPSPSGFFRLETSTPARIFDYDGVEKIGALTFDEVERLLWNWFYPGGLDNLPFTAHPRIEVAAVQAAIWHYSDGFEAADTGPITFQPGVLTGWPPLASGVTRQQILDRYLELVAIGDAATVPPAPALQVSAAKIGDAAVFDVSGSNLDEPLLGATLDAQGRPIYAFDQNLQQCDLASPISTLDITATSELVCVPLQSGTQDSAIELTVAGSAEIEDMIYLERGSNQDIVVLGSRSVALTERARAPFNPPAAIPALSPLGLAGSVLLMIWFAWREKRQRA